jgi:hypothetical protein
MCFHAEGVATPKSPMVGSLPACCACATSGNAAAPPSQRDELAPPHSITSSARPSSGSGILRPSVFRCFEIDYQLDLRGLLDHWEVRRLSAFENLTGVHTHVVIGIGKIGSIAHQAARIGELANEIDCRQRVTSR